MTHKSKVNRGELPQYYVTDNHPAIIEKPAWNRVQEELARRSGKRKVKEVGTKTEQGKYSSKYALTELLVCGHCDTPYRRCTWSKNGKKKIVWRCISRLDYGKKYCKESATIEESRLQSAILDAIGELAQTDTVALETLKIHIGMGLKNRESHHDDPYAMQFRMIAIDKAIGELTALQAQAEIARDDADYYNKKLISLCGEKSSLKEKLTQIKSDNNHVGAEKSRLDEIFTVADGLKNRPLKWDEVIICQMVECVKVLGKNRIKIFCRVGGEVEMELG